MKNCNKILIGKHKKTSALSSGEIDVNEHVTVAEILPTSIRSKVLGHTKFTYARLGKG